MTESLNKCRVDILIRDLVVTVTVVDLPCSKTVNHLLRITTVYGLQ